MAKDNICTLTVILADVTTCVNATDLRACVRIGKNHVSNVNNTFKKY